MTIGQKIKSLRISMKLTQDELALAAKTTKQTIHKYETGIITNIPASKIKAIADRLGTTPAYLMGWDTSIESTTDDTITASDAHLTDEEKAFLNLFNQLDSADKTNLRNYINNVLLVAEKYQVKKESFGA